MKCKQLFILVALVLSLPLSSQAHAADAPQDRYAQIAELEIDPAQLDRYKAAVEEQIEAAIRLEPGVRVLYAVFETENPARVRLFEVYASTGAYKAHLQAEHFRKYRDDGPDGQVAQACSGRSSVARRESAMSTRRSASRSNTVREREDKG